MDAKLIKVLEHYHLYDGDKAIATTIVGNPMLLPNLSLKNCQAIKRGYDLDELSRKIREEEEPQIKIGKSLAEGIIASLHFEEGVRKGFQKALEILGDRRFTEEDVMISMDRVWGWCNGSVLDQNCSTMAELKDKYIQSLQQNEWDVEVEMEPYHDGKFANDGKTHSFEVKWRPKLDADGCLILKRKSE